MRFSILWLALLLPMFSSPLLAETVQERSLAQAELRVNRMSCPLCAVTVRKALERVPGVVRAEVDFETKRAVVTYDPEKTGLEALIKAIEEAGYGAEIAGSGEQK